MAISDGTIVAVPELQDYYPGTIIGTWGAAELVSEKFSQAETNADNALINANAALEVLRDLFVDAEMPTDVDDIDYPTHDVSLDTSDIPAKPVEPTDDDLTPGDVTAPTLDDVPAVSIPSVNITATAPSDPTIDFSFSEDSYSTGLLTLIRAALEDYVENGGTGLGTDVEAAIWERARARKDLENERVYDEANEYFSARGHDIPPGALSGRLVEALKEQARATAQINYEIAIEQARLAQNNTQHALTASIQLEGVGMNHASSVAGRALEKAKAACDVIVKTYNALVSGFVAKLEKSKIEASVADSRANAQVAQGNQVIAKYTADVEGYKVQVAVELGIVESVAKVYGFKVAGYEAEARIAVETLKAQIEAYKGQLMQSDNETQLTLKEAELTLHSYLGALALQTEAAKGTANVSAQLAASALNSVNASASLGATAGVSRSDGISHSTSITNTALLGESHSYGE